jgi:hypothetical protein
MKTHFIATVERPDVYHRVGVVGNGKMDRFLNQMGEVLLEMADILPVEFFHAVTQVLPPGGFFVHF